MHTPKENECSLLSVGWHVSSAVGLPLHSGRAKQQCVGEISTRYKNRGVSFKCRIRVSKYIFFLAEKRTSNQTPSGLALPLRRIAGRERARKRWVKGRRTAFQPAALGDARQRSPLRGGRGAGGKAAQAGRPRAISWGEKVSSGSELPARRQRSSRGRRALPGFGTEQEKTNRCRASIQPRGGGIQTALSSGDLCRSNEPFFFYLLLCSEQSALPV